MKHRTIIIIIIFCIWWGVPQLRPRSEL